MAFDFFHELEQARKLASTEQEICTPVARRSAGDGGYTVVRLPCGDFHVCGGTHGCKFATEDKESYLVCPYSGAIVGHTAVRSDDAEWTGKSGRSANPDDVGGLPIGGAWRARRDMFQASVQAHMNAKAFKDEENVMPVYVETDKERRTREERQSAKRGALCVDQEPDERVPKRHRTSKKHIRDSDSLFQKLSEEASTVIERLLSTQRQANASASEKTSVGDAPVAQPDPRLQNIDFVTKVALRRYVNECKLKGETANLVAMHDVVVAAHQFVKEQREAAIERRKHEARCSHRFTSEVKQAASRLIVGLWRASCLTVHMAQSKRGADSFRPFASGVLYGLKRGVRLPDGTTVVPELPELASHLPTLRSTDATSQAKQLHASSHRGLCSLHRSVASMSSVNREEIESALRAFADCSTLARELVAHVKRLERGL